MGELIKTFCGFFSNPGDKVEGYVTKSNRKVLKAKNSKGIKYSATQYPNGTIHETRTIRPKK
ncbi:MAG: hypothetical protein J6K42_06610 [Clostridia bacterium]|nr:hypothetical protein [Clostridia bacterium]